MNRNNNPVTKSINGQSKLRIWEYYSSNEDIFAYCFFTDESVHGINAIYRIDV